MTLTLTVQFEVTNIAWGTPEWLQHPQNWRKGEPHLPQGLHLHPETGSEKHNIIVPVLLTSFCWRAHSLRLEAGSYLDLNWAALYLLCHISSYPRRVMAFKLSDQSLPWWGKDPRLSHLFPHSKREKVNLITKNLTKTYLTNCSKHIAGNIYNGLHFMYL